MNYKTISWLEDRWSAEELLALSDQVIEYRQTLINDVIANNQREYDLAVIDLNIKRDAFRRFYPRKAMPSHLKRGIQHPPKLQERWQRLLSRRRSILNERERFKESKRTVFLDRMANGRQEAMRQREKSIRALIDQEATKRGVTLTERAIDKRLNELFNGHS